MKSQAKPQKGSDIVLEEQEQRTKLSESKARAGAVVKTQRATTRGKVAKAVGVMVAGATLGYVAGALTAPASGKETRRKIGQKVEKGAKAVANKVRSSVASAKTEAATMRLKAKTSLTKATDRLADKIHS